MLWQKMGMDEGEGIGKSTYPTVPAKTNNIYSKRSVVFMMLNDSMKHSGVFCNTPSDLIMKKKKNLH